MITVYLLLIVCFLSVIYTIDEYNVYCWGRNDFNQLGLDNHERVFVPIKLEGFYQSNRAIQICSSYTHTFILTRDDNDRSHVYASGNSEYLFDQPLSQFVPVDTLEKYDIIKIGSGKHHACFLTLNGDILGLGSNSVGQVNLQCNLMLALFKKRCKINHTSPPYSRFSML